MINSTQNQIQEPCIQTPKTKQQENSIEKLKKSNKKQVREMNSKSRKYYQVIQETNKQNIIARQMKSKNVAPIQTQNVIYNKNSLNSLPTTINNNAKHLCPSSNNSSSVYPVEDGTRANHNNAHININLDAKLICHRSSTNTNVNSPTLNGNHNHNSNPIVGILNSNLNIHKPTSNQRVLANVDVDYVHTHGNSCSPRTQPHTYTYKHAQSKNSINIANTNAKSKDQYSKINPNQKNNNSKNHAISQMQIYTRNYQAFNCNTGSLGFIANCQSNTSMNDHYSQNNGSSNNNVSTNNYNNGCGNNVQDASMKSNRGYSNIQKNQSKKNVASLHKGHSANPNSTNTANSGTGQHDNIIKQRQSYSGVVKQRNIKLPKINSYNNNILVNQINIANHKEQSMPFLQNTNGSLGNNSTVLNINKRKYSKSYKKIQTQPCQNYGSDDQFNPNIPTHQPVDNSTNRNHKYDSYNYGQMENGPQSQTNTININALQANSRTKPSNKSNHTINCNSKNRSSCKGKLKLNQDCNKNDAKTKISKVNNPIISITAPSPLEASIHDGNRRVNGNSTSPSIGSPRNEKQSIKQTLLNIVKQKENRHLVSIDQQIEKLDNLTKRYTYLRKDLVSIQEDIITMSFKQREKEKQKDRAKRTKQIDLINCNSITNI